MAYNDDNISQRDHLTPTHKVPMRQCRCMAELLAPTFDIFPSKKKSLKKKETNTRKGKISLYQYIHKDHLHFLLISLKEKVFSIYWTLQLVKIGKKWIKWCCLFRQY